MLRNHRFQFIQNAISFQFHGGGKFSLSEGVPLHYNIFLRFVKHLLQFDQFLQLFNPFAHDRRTNAPRQKHKRLLTSFYFCAIF